MSEEQQLRARDLLRKKLAQASARVEAAAKERLNHATAARILSKEEHQRPASMAPPEPAEGNDAALAWPQLRKEHLR